MNSFNLDNLVRENVSRMKPYSSARDEFKDFDVDMIFLDANENPFETGVNRYPDPQQRNLKEELAKQKDVNSKNILLGNGSDEILDLIYRAFCNPTKDNIITCPPTYGMYRVLAETNAVENREVLLTNDFELEVEAILNAVNSDSKLICFCSPNNPTGNVFDTESVEKLLKSFSGLIIIDEAYIDFSSQKSWLNRLQEFPNLIITQTLSKAYGLAGIRLGICYASIEIITVLNKIKPPYNVNALTQRSALNRIVDYKTIENEINNILKEKDKLLKVLLQINFIKKVYRTDANFVLIKVDDADKRYTQLLDKNVVIRNRSTQPLCENCLRLTIGTSEENKKLIKALKVLE